MKLLGGHKLLVLLGSLASALVAGTGYAADSPKPGVRHDVVDEIAARYLASEESLPYEVALARIEEQDAFVAILPTVIREAGPDTWAGSWIDHDGDGSLVVQLASDARTAVLAAAVPADLRARVRFERVPYSLQALELKIKDLMPTLEVIGDGIDPYIDEQHNEIVLNVPAELGPLALADVARASSRLPVRVVSTGRAEVPAACSTSLQVCDEPVRGGVEITSATFNALYPPHILNCTLGFAVQNISNPSEKWAITAGHCNPVVHPQTWITGRPNFTNWVLGNSPANMIFDPGAAPSAFEHDVLAMTVPAASLTHSWVLVQASGGLTSPTTFNDFYPINGLGGALPNNAYLCKTGQFSGTECAYKIGAYGYYTTMKNTVNEWASIVCHGDSGGPVYKQNLGYGIISTIVETGEETRPTYFKGLVTRGCSGAGGTWKFYSLSVALAMTNMQLIP